MSSTTPARTPRFQVALDDCTAVVDTSFSTSAPRLAKVLCRAVDETDAAFVARACSSYEYLVAALLACMAADGAAQRRAACAAARAALAVAEV